MLAWGSVAGHPVHNHSFICLARCCLRAMSTGAWEKGQAAQIRLSTVSLGGIGEEEGYKVAKSLEGSQLTAGGDIAQYA